MKTWLQISKKLVTVFVSRFLDCLLPTRDGNGNGNDRIWNALKASRDDKGDLEENDAHDHDGFDTEGEEIFHTFPRALCSRANHGDLGSFGERNPFTAEVLGQTKIPRRNSQIQSATTGLSPDPFG